MTKREEQFKLLELEPTSDAREIKRAYAKMAAKVHPEEQPEKWEQIHAAYLSLLDDANRRSGKGVVSKNSATSGIVLTPPGMSPSEILEKHEKTKGKGNNKPQENELDSAMEKLVADSSEYAASKEKLEEVIRIMKNIPTTKAPFCGKLPMNADAYRQMISLESFQNALKDSYFKQQYDKIMECCITPEEEKKLSVKHPLRGLIHHNKFFFWLFRDTYNLYDYVRYGDAKYDIDYDSEIRIDKNKKGYRCELTIGGIIYSVLCIYHIQYSTFNIGGLWTADYASPEDCLSACLAVSNHFEKQYKKHCVLRFLRQFVLLLFELLLGVSIIGAFVLIPFKKIEFGVPIMIGIMTLNLIYKMTTVMGYNKKYGFETGKK